MRNDLHQRSASKLIQENFTTICHIVVLIFAFALILAFTLSSLAYSRSVERAEKIIEEHEEIEKIKAEMRPMEEIGDMLFLHIGNNNTRNPNKDNIKAMAVVTYNAHQYTTQILSIRGDVYISDNDKGKGSSLISRFNRRKPEKFMDALNSVTDLNVENYITVNSRKIRDLVDRVAFISINVKEEEIELVNKKQEKLAKEFKLPGYKPVEWAGKQQLTGLQAAAYSEISLKKNSEAGRNRHFCKVLRAIMKSLKECSVEDMLLARSILYSGARKVDPDYMVDFVARMRGFRRGPFIKWPTRTERYKYKTKETKYQFLMTTIRNARELQIALGYPDYKPSKEVKKRNKYNKATLKIIEQIRKAKEEARRRALEEAKRKAEEEERQKELEEMEAERKRQEEANRSSQNQNSGNNSSSDKKKKKEQEDSGGSSDSGDTKPTPTPPPAPEPKPEPSGGGDSGSGSDSGEEAVDLDG